MSRSRKQHFRHFLHSNFCFSPLCDLKYVRRFLRDFFHPRALKTKKTLSGEGENEWMDE